MRVAAAVRSTGSALTSRLLALAGALAAPAGAGLVDPLGVEFQVNSYTTSAQRQASVSAESNGDFVVVWRGHSDGDSYGVFGRRFTALGTPLASEFVVNSYTTGNQSGPAVAMDSDGDFVVVWPSDQDGFFAGVFGQRFASNGARRGTEFQINVYTTSFQSGSAVALDANGDFVVAWASNGQDGSSTGIFGRRFSSAGAPVAIEFQVNVYTSGQQTLPDVALDASGDLVVAWRSNYQDGDSHGVFARRFDSANVPQAAEFQVNALTVSTQDLPAVAMRDDGAFILAWAEFRAGVGETVLASRYDAGGVPQAGEFVVNVFTYYQETSPDVAIDGDGDFVVVWRTRIQDGSLYGVSARRFLSSGAAYVAEFQVNSYTPMFQFEAKAAMGDDGDLVVVWSSSHGQDGDSYGVFGRRFAGLAALDADADGAFSALIDGVLVLRFAFGFSGPALSSGAVGANCLRCTGDEVEDYLASLGTALDVDDDGEIDPLVDGVLVLRFGFGFSGDALVSGAVDADCNRCEAGEIEKYLASLTS